MPCGWWTIARSVLSIESRMPRAPSPAFTMPPSASRRRRAIFSPKLVGPEAARTSNLRSCISTANVPSCGRRRSAISMSLSTFTAETTARPSAPAICDTFCSMPSIRQRTTSSSPAFGSRWMSVARSCTALVKISCTVFTAWEISRSSPSLPRPSTGVPSLRSSTMPVAAGVATEARGEKISPNCRSRPSCVAAMRAIRRANCLWRILQAAGTLVSR